MAKRVLCAGILVGDFLVKPVTRMPERGKLSLTDHTELATGGCAANTGVVLKKLGIDVGLVGKVGRDALGDFVRNKLAEEGLEVSGISTVAGINTSGTAVFIHPDGERSFIHSIGANAEFSPEDVSFDYVKKFPIVHVAGVFLMPKFEGRPLGEFARRVREAGCIMCLDTAWDSRGVWLKGVKDALPHLDYFVPSIEEAKMITGREKPEEIASFLIDAGVKNVGLKMGGDGSFIMNREMKKYFPALKFDVVDATGCGDSYAAGFIAGLARDLSFEQCGLLANLTGAKNATAIGATGGVVSWDDLLEFGKKHGYSL